MWLIIRNSGGMFHYAPSPISSRTNDRIKAPDIPEGHVQKCYYYIKLICSPELKFWWLDGYIRYMDHCVIVKNLPENPKYTNLASLDFVRLSH